jgi:hypothetical protein
MAGGRRVPIFRGARQAGARPWWRSVLDFTGTMLQYASWVRALEAGPIPVSKLRLLAERVYAQCDEKDGLQDGLIDDPRRCGFQPSQHLPRCASTGLPIQILISDVT